MIQTRRFRRIGGKIVAIIHVYCRILYLGRNIGVVWILIPFRYPKNSRVLRPRQFKCKFQRKLFVCMRNWETVAIHEVIIDQFLIST